MTLLIFGILLYVAGHFFKRVLPGVHAGLGPAGKGVSAVTILGGVVLMVIGYRGADFVPVYDAPDWGRHLNNLLMFFAVMLFGLGSSKSPMRSWMRHPMLTGGIVWAVAHLMVNGDLASVLLFGAIGIWAMVEIMVINRADPDYVAFEGGTTAGTVRLVLISAVVYAVIAAVHTWLGYYPFPGG
jgi:uncharacterized membrane protein